MHKGVVIACCMQISQMAQSHERVEKATEKGPMVANIRILMQNSH